MSNPKRLDRRRKAFDELRSAGSGPKSTDKWVPGIRGDMKHSMYHRPGSNKKR